VNGIERNVIAISGPPGAGSTTIAKELAERLGITYFSPGFIQKGFAKGKNQSKAAIEVWKTKMGKSREFHKELDDLQIERAKQGNVVVCGKLSIYFLKDLADFKIWVDASLDERAKRSAKRDKLPVEKVKGMMSEREKTEREEWMKIYGFDYFNQKKMADLVIDSTNLTVEETVNKILDFIKIRKIGKKNTSELLELYEKKREEIQERLLEFRQMLNNDDERIFAELAFCICTPQSKATTAWNAISALMKNGLLYRGSAKEISPFLNAVRFGRNKVEYIAEARKKFTVDDILQIKEFIQSFIDPVELREWLAENVRGLGMKEASHFIRNVGLSENQLAILDIHILNNLREYDVIEKIPKTLSKKEYLIIEGKMKEFSKQVNVPLDELDLLFWSNETGFVFK